MKINESDLRRMIKYEVSKLLEQSQNSLGWKISVFPRYQNAEGVDFLHSFLDSAMKDLGQGSVGDQKSGSVIFWLPAERERDFLNFAARSGASEKLQITKIQKNF